MLTAYRNISLAFVFIASLNALAQQDSVILFNGKSYIGKIEKVEKGYVYITTSSNESTQLELDRVFSYTQNKTETVCYVKNEMTGDFLTEQEVRFATIGSYDARQTVKPRFVFYSSLAFGLGVSLLDTYYTQKAYDEFVEINMAPPVNAQVGFFGAKPTLMPIIVPMILSATWALLSMRIKDHQLLHKEMYGNQDYYRGFNRIARQKRLMAALKGSSIGIGLGITSYLIAKQF